MFAIERRHRLLVVLGKPRELLLVVVLVEGDEDLRKREEKIDENVCLPILLESIFFWLEFLLGGGVRHV